MSKKSSSKNCEGQLSLDDYLNVQPPEQLFAVSKIFARAKKQMNVAELKTFIYCLCKIKWTEEMPDFVMLDKKTLAKIVGINSDPDHLSVDLKRSIVHLPDHSLVEFASKDKEFYDRGFLVSRISMLRDIVRVKFNSEYLSLFSSLEKDYITMWSADIFRMRSERSILFYEDLRLNSDTRGTNTKTYGVKNLKDLFGIPEKGKGSYMRENGGFDRTSFERYVLEPLCDDLLKCHMVQLVLFENGKPYRKVKEGGSVLGYEFCWNVSERPKMMDAKESQELNTAIDKNPELLKIAKDLKDGKKNTRKSKDPFRQFEQRDYNFEEIERMLLSN